MVRIPSAAASQLSTFSCVKAWSKPVIIASLFKGSPITPVENGKTALTSMSALLASAVQISVARRSPSAPVPALALPVLMIK